MTKRELARRKIESIILSNAHKLFYLTRGNEVIAEINRELAIEMRAAIAEIAPVRQEVQIVRESDEVVVVLCRLRVDAEDWQDEVSEVGEAWAVELGEKNAQQVRTRLYRTATTRALKRAVEALVGDMYHLLRGLGVLYAYKQANKLGSELKALPAQAAEVVRAVGEKRLGTQEAIQKLKQLSV